MFGVFTLRLSSGLGSRIDAWQARAQRSGPLGLALAGALSVLVVSPCVSAPLAGALVFISSTGDAIIGGAALLALALGMGVPLVLVGGFGTTLLPRSGGWMNGVKIAFGVLLLGVAVWLIERLIPAPLTLLLWAGLAIGTALALGALDLASTPAGRGSARVSALCCWCGASPWSSAPARGGADPLRPLATGPMGITSTSTGAATQAAHPDRIVESLGQLQAVLAESTTPAFVNVTAEWCISCKVMEREVFPAPQVREALADFRWIDVDVTDTSAESREVLDHLGLFGPPSLLFFDGAQELRQARIQGELDADALAGHIAAVQRALEGAQAPATNG